MQRSHFSFFLLIPILAASSCLSTGTGTGSGGAVGSGGVAGSANLAGLNRSSYQGLKAFPVSMARIQGRQEAILVKVDKCVGTFRVQASVHTSSGQTNFSGVRASSELVGGRARPEKPKPPRKDAFPYGLAMERYEKELEAYEENLFKWGEGAAQELEGYMFDVSSGFKGYGAHGLRLRITPSESNIGEWQIKVSVRRKRSDGILEGVTSFFLTSESLPNHPPGRPLDDRVVLFNASQ